MALPEIDVIATTISGSISDWSKVERIVPLFRQRGVDGVRLFAVDSHAEARRRTRQCVTGGCRTLISAGGSGTFNSVLEGCIDSGVALSEVTLGFLRKGSADLIGKTLGMPDEIEAAVDVFVDSIREARTVPCDVIRARGEGLGEGPRHFVGYGGTGIFGRIPHYTENRFIKYYKGVLSQWFGDLGPFFVGAMLASIDRSARELFRGSPEWRILVEGAEAGRGRYRSMILANGYLGPDLPFARDVPLGSGDFRLFALRDLGLLRLPGQFRRAWDASILKEPQEYGFESYRVEGELEVALDGGGSFPVNVDGSTLKCTGSANFRIVDRVGLLAAESARSVPTAADGESGQNADR